MVQRNVAYRFINDCIPHKARLYAILQDLSMSNLGLIRFISVDLAEHFLFFCPAKASVWQAMILEFLWPTVEISDFIQAIRSFDFHNI